jgi:phytoene synthase
MYAEQAVLDEGFRLCQAIAREYGTSYYFATQFFPRETRRAIYALYSFARIPDEFVDNPDKTDVTQVREQLEDWREKWRAAMKADRVDDPVMAAIVSTFHKYRIPADDGEAFIRSMIQDTEKETYSDYEELEEYMYGSAGVIGLMVTRVVGYSTEDCFKNALQLGYAFQLTNFLRDIGEDWDLRRRVYMPQDELARYGLNNGDIAAHRYDEKFIEFMQFQIERNREIYKEAVKGIPMLHLRGRLAVRISYVLYSAILGRIERLNYNIYKDRARTSFPRKLALTARALLGVYE